MKGIAKHTMLIIMGLLSLWMIYSAMMKIAGYPGMEESFYVWGYPKWFMIAVGIFELILSVLIFAKQTRVYGLSLLIIFMFGAIYTHISSNDDPSQMYSALFTIVLSSSCLMLIWLLKKMKHY